MTIRVRTQIDVTAIQRKTAPVALEVRRGLEQEASFWETRLKAVTPVDTGRLRRSSKATVRQAGRRLVIRIGWFFVPYARYVEDPAVPPHGHIVAGVAAEMERSVLERGRKLIAAALRKR